MRVSELPVTHLAGVGPVRQRDLASLEIFTIEDLLLYYPFRYEDRQLAEPALYTDGARITVRGVVNGMPSLRYRGRKATLVVPVLSDQNVSISAVWFNQPYLKEQMAPGRNITITGKYDARRRSVTVAQHDWHKPSDSIHSGRVVPMYRIRGELTQKILRTLISQALKQYTAQLEDILPFSIRKKYQLMERVDAVRSMHFPKDGQELKQAKRRLIFEEFFLFQCQLQAFRYMHRYENKGIAHPCKGDDVRKFLEHLPFSLTSAQERACKEIIYDMRAKEAMTRLLQGDVGSGKTVIAFLAMHLMKCDGYQSALMVPTEILAEQHVQSAKSLFREFDCNIALLTGSMKESERRKVLAGLMAGDIDIVIGTHALLEERVSFARLGLVITDEQHRFGVGQRAIFRQKGHSPDVLFMSATPIPRTMAMTLFGDLDVSVIDQMPAGRVPIRTHWITQEREDDCIRLMRKELAKGRQAYIVCPLIDESTQLEDVESATLVYERMCEELAGFQVGLMHGKLSGQEKEQVMRSYLANQLQVLVSTTVIEVGVNVPNATVMVIYNAERFGLAQLHQLRGRVGRSNLQSYCILLANPQTQTGRERMRAMVETTNGFVLAEKDLQLRGPGEFFGFRQSGLPEFRLGDLVSDIRIMEVAQKEVAALLRDPGFWLHPEYQGLLQFLKQTNVLMAPLQD
ncbi:ATP-dependent DNA helicase RecG [Fodinisporobacter ferrooxydans]|uniref:ATP-dependent DNA helicase RecG n=1 Tax=Fodinisporobacter ferrooxydans TaxID=2901836 RepID=A0ABY4CID3_9BACL|nr:ATP-dependent DNA helicase RecG [Alicyclobacillaceae bacterium MYW30-H2]